MYSDSNLGGFEPKPELLTLLKLQEDEERGTQPRNEDRECRVGQVEDAEVPDGVRSKPSQSPACGT